MNNKRHDYVYYSCEEHGVIASSVPCERCKAPAKLFNQAGDKLSDALFAVAEISANPVRKKLILERIEKLQMRLLDLLSESNEDDRVMQLIRDVAFIEAQTRGLR